MSYPYMIQGDNIVVVIDNTPHTINKSHITYSKVVDAIKAGDWTTLKAIVDPAKVVINFGKGRVSVQGNKVFWDNQEMHNALSRRLVEMINDGFSVEPLVLFMDNLQNNPSFRAVNELYGFLEKCKLPITPDGCFLAYKKVNSDYLDIHSKTVPNKPANLFTDAEKATLPLTVGKQKEVTVDIVDGVTTVSMPRNQVNDDKNNTCAEGLHFCSQSYLDHFGNSTTDKVVIVKINPADVVSIPSDYHDTKGRCYKYQVIGELGVKPDDAFTASVQDSANTADVTA